MNCKIIPNCADDKASRARISASLTVEAALILPLLLSVMLFFLSFLQIIRTEQQLYYAAAEVAEETAACGYMLKYAQQEFDALWEDGKEYYEVTGFVTDILQSAGDALWFRKALRTKLADEECINTMIPGGLSGIDFWGSEIYAEDEMTVVRMRFDISFPVFQSFLPKLPFEKNIVLRSFSGVGAFERDENEDEEEAFEDEEEEGYVFVTENGTVYHLSANCTYIRLSVKKADIREVAEKRNQYGGKYYPCEGCLKKDTPPSVVWLTKTGTRYHAQKDCSKIKRTVKKIPRSEAAAYRPCSRCAKEM